MRMMTAVVVLCLACMMAMPANAQQVDVAFGGGSTASPGSGANALFALPADRGGAYLGFSGDVLIKGNLGVQAEINWRASQTLYEGQLPYRPLFYDFNGIYAPRFNKYVGAEVLAGIGAESVRFYQNTYYCDFYGNCTNYISSTHFMGDLGGGVKLYPYGNFFVRPEMRLYLVHNNVEFNSGHVLRYGVSIGYTFGGR